MAHPHCRLLPRGVKSLPLGLAAAARNALSTADTENTEKRWEKDS